jgi:transcriptional regulator with GAF, ATPase, and Fis domain
MKKRIGFDESIQEFRNILKSKVSRERKFERALKCIDQFFGAERGLLLEAKGKDELLIRALANLDGRKVFSGEFISSTVLTEVRKKKKAVVTEDAVFDPRYDEKRSVIVSGLRSIMCAPIISQKKLIGIIYIDHRGKEGLFDSKDLRQLRRFLTELRKLMLSE